MKNLSLSKKILIDCLFYFAGLLLATIPSVLCYGIIDKVAISPLYIEWIVPFYLIVVSIFMDLKYSTPFSIWRVLPCGVIVGTGWYVTRIVFENYFASKGDLPDPWTYIISDGFSQICCWIVLIALVIYQLVISAVWIYKKVKSHKETE